MRLLNLIVMLALLNVLYGYVSAHPERFRGWIHLPYNLIIWGD